MNKTITAIAALVIVGCGQQDVEGLNNATVSALEAPQSSFASDKVETPSPMNQSIFIALKKDMPKCSEDRQGQLVYIQELKQLQFCDSGEWVAIELPKPEKGEKGDRGLAGESGKDGVGIAGKDGKDGIDGKDSVSTIETIIEKETIVQLETVETTIVQQEVVTNTINNTIDNSLKVYSVDNVLLGKFIDNDFVSNIIYIENNGYQYRLDSSGSMRNEYVFYTGANCTGDKYAAKIQNINVHYETLTNTVFKEVGSVIKNFVYQSRSNGLTCTNGSNSTLIATAIEPITYQTVGLPSLPYQTNGTNFYWYTSK